MSTRQVLCIVLLGLGLWGCRTPRGMLQTKEGRAPITPRPLSEIQVIDHIAVRDRDGRTSWEENGHTYEADMGWVTRLSITDHLPTLSGVETLRYLDGAWASYLNERLSRVGIRIEKVILSVSNHLIVFRGYEAPSRRRIVDCLIAPHSQIRRVGVQYTQPGVFTSENMAVREFYEFPAEDQILIVDHLRDRNDVGDLCIAYILQDISQFSEDELERYSFLGYTWYRRLFTNRSTTYQHIAKFLSPITVSLLPSCRYKEFVPRNSSEVIPKTYLTKEVGVK